MRHEPDDNSPAPDIAPALDAICPMHLQLDARGRITHAGPTLQKLRPHRPMAGLGFLDLFHMIHPRNIHGMQDLRAASGGRARMRLRFRDPPHTDLLGVLVPLGQGGTLVNLGFGLSLLEALRDYSLTNTDFAVTDPTMEMLFLVEAKSAAMDASRKLTHQLDLARVAAEEQAYTDTLTGLGNRRALDQMLRRMIDSGQEFALMHLDLDFFKAVNDTLGHAAGDHVLEQAARIMTEETRAEDVVTRVGGDEFVMLFHNLCHRPGIEDIAQRMIRRLGQPMPWQGKTCRISASLGTTLSTDYQAPTAEQMLSDADAALYAAKRAGRSRHRFHAAGEPVAGGHVPEGRTAGQ